MIRLLIAVVCLSAGLQAQSRLYRTLKLENGAQVIYNTFSEVSLKEDQRRMFGTATVSGNTIERTMTDGSNHTWLGFQIKIDRIPGDPIRFNLSMEPLGGWGFFGQNAAPRVIENGDRVLLDVLEEPGTGRKLVDSFQVGIGVDMQAVPMTKTIPQMPAAGAAIHLQSPRLQKSGPNAMISMGASDSSVTGAMAALLVPGTGRFIFSSHAEPGFRMDGAGEGNRLSFAAGRDIYFIECSSPVMDGAGAWYLWVRFEPAADKQQAGIPTLELAHQEIQK